MLAEASVVDRVTDGLVAAAESAVVGPGTAEGVTMGPLISSAHRERVAGFVDRARAEGVEVLAGGGVPEGCDRGWFYAPTVTRVGELGANEITTDEVFGPVVTVVPFEDEDHLVAMANANRYGLAAGIWTEHLDRAMRLPRRLRAGVVWVNGYDRFDGAVPFGGTKRSGYGRDMGHAGIDEYTETKTVWINHSGQSW